jgi:uncharacterized membrane protein required for colicin V production
MIAWILAVLIVAIVALVGYYQGGIRAAFSFIGLLIAVSVAQPLGNVLSPMIAAMGLKQPVALNFLGPIVAFLIVLTIFKAIAFAVNKQIETYYKYKDSETKRLMFERLNTRLGIAVGVANGVIYFFIIAVLMHVLGYFAVQVKGAQNDAFTTKLAAKMGEDLQSAGMTKAISPFVPASETYYDASDIIGDVYHNPLLQKRLASYPVFVTLAERPEFKGMADDLKFQEFWLRQPRPSIGELLAHEKVKPLVNSEALFKDILKMLGGDLKDLKAYVETGKSAKYDDEKILGRWNFDYRDSIALARRNKPNMASVELRQLRRVLGGTMANATLTATIDKRVILRTPSNSKAPSTEGSWEAQSGGKYLLKLNEGGKSYEVPAIVDANRVVVTRDNYAMVFEK